MKAGPYGGLNLPSSGIDSNGLVRRTEFGGLYRDVYLVETGRRCT